VQGNETSANAQRVNYDAAVNGRVQVLGLGGKDLFASDDTSAIVTLDGGAGDDSFQIGQIFGAKRDVAAGGLAADDVFPVLIATTRGWLSPGSGAPLIAQGGAGNDQFTVYSNQAELRLEGDDGDDFFTVRAFALAVVLDTDTDGNGVLDAHLTTGAEQWQDDVIPLSNGVAQPVIGSGFSTARPLDIRTGGGADEVQYNLNAPVSVDGGAGFDKVAVLGTEFADDIVITKQGVLGAGVNVRYANVEAIEVDGLEGDDEFFVQSTAFGVSYRVIGGLGSDTINVAGDVSEDIVVRDLEGASGTINHLVTSTGDRGYDGLAAAGIGLHVAGINEGIVVVTETGGFTRVREGGGPAAIDAYTVRLSRAPVGTVHVTVSAARSGQGEQAAGDTLWLCTAATAAGCDAPAEFQRRITLNGQPTDVPQRALVLVFDATNWSVAQTVYVLAIDDALAEGDRVVTVSHSTIAPVAADKALFDHAAVRNVEVTLRDNDTPGLYVVEVAPGTSAEDGESIVLEGDGAAAVADQLLISLAKAPAAGTQVVIRLSLGDAQIALSSADPRFNAALRTVTFTSANFDQAVRITVTAVQDLDRDDPRTTGITFTRDAATTDAGYQFDPQRIGVRVLDDDTPGVLVVESNGSTVVTVGGPGDEYTIRLTKQPVAAVRVAIVTDGLTDVRTINGAPVAYQAIGTAGRGLYTGVVSIDPATRRITRTDGGSWLAAGFLEGQRIAIDGAGTFKIAVIRGTNASKDDVLELTAEFAVPAIATGVHTIVRVAAVVTFTAADHAAPRTIGVSADPFFTIPPVRAGVRLFGALPHLLADLEGPLAVEGAVSGADRSLKPGLKLAGEKDGPLFGIGTQPSESQQVDVLNIYDDSSQADGTFTLTPTNLSGPGLPGALPPRGAVFGEPSSVPAGISFGQVTFTRDPVTGRVTGIATDATRSTIEVLNILLGSGNDTMRIDGTLLAAPEDDGNPATTPNPPAVHGTLTVVHGGGNTRLGSGAMGGDTIIITGGAGPGSPLVVYGDTSQDGRWYSGDPATVAGGDFGAKPFDAFPGVADEDERFNFPLGNPFDDAGNDVIDARALFAGVASGSLPSVGFVAYGGAGDDTMYGSQAGDFLAGGSGNDTIHGQRGIDQIYGDSGINVDHILRELYIPTTNTSAAPNADGLVAGRDAIQGDGPGSAAGTDGDFADVIFGDHGRVDQDVLSAAVGGTSGGYVRPAAKPQRIQTTQRIDRVQTVEPLNGADDVIAGNQGDDRILGGNGADTINGQQGADIIFGDHGAIEYRLDRTRNDDSQRLDVDLITTLDPTLGAADVITGDEGKDIILGGTGGDSIRGNGADDWILGDFGSISYVADNGVSTDVRRITTSDPELGGDDVIRGDEDQDIVLGGNGRDTIRGDAGLDVLLGDNGYVDFVTRDGDSSGMDVISTTDPVLGAADTIDGDEGNDIVLGGTAGDTISGNAGNDLIFGDHGKVEGDIRAALLPLSMAVHPFTWTSIDTGATQGGGDDLIRGNAGDDIVIGGQGIDRITGGDDDDDLIGGHNVAGGSDAGDFIDAGAGNDWVAGDNANLLRTGSRLSPRFRVLAGQLIYDDLGTALVTAAWQLDPNLANEERAVVLFNHSAGEPAGTFGADNIAGGAEDDVIFGQLGDDWIQGDGSSIDDTGAITIDVVATRQSREDHAGLDRDGRDWIEGNGGADTVFGGLGQDDVIGGSSTLHSLATPARRPDGADTLFGGAGVRLVRNSFGDLAEDGHAHDADVVLGDNADVFRLVGRGGIASSPSAFLTFTYDTYSQAERIIPRAYTLVDYTQGGRRPTSAPPTSSTARAATTRSTA
jgi:Ca2+-binding RTX toxin-like protein